jgi:hypothetical protein
MESDSGARDAPGHECCQNRSREHDSLSSGHVTSARGTGHGALPVVARSPWALWSAASRQSGRMSAWEPGTPRGIDAPVRDRTCLTLLPRVRRTP